MKNSAFLMIAFLFLVSCKKEEKKPAIIFSEDRMVEVLTEFQIAEATVRLGYHRTADSINLNDSMYAATFRKLGITEQEFDTNYSYYMKRPKEFEKIAEKVITNLSKKAASLKVKKEESPRID